MPINGQKVILLLMIKNESKIIDRCLREAVLNVDAVYVLDTGSTDNTVEVTKNTLTELGKPFEITTEPFKNFGHSRTTSVVRCTQFAKNMGWDLKKTYALAIDADMVLCPQPGYKNFDLNMKGYLIIQKNPRIKYYNIRFLNLATNWKCTGATHEFWDAGETSNMGRIAEDIIYIDDKNDGGCKHDKFERDARLLENELKEEPENHRTTFYLAQTYKDLGRFKDAIKYYKKRIALGGWYEEVWYSYYMMAKMYELINEPEKMELYMLKGYKYHPKRAEGIYHLTQYFRNKGQHHKAYQYYLLGKDIKFPEEDGLFLENHVYEGLFDYEYTILASYVHNKSNNSMHSIINYINKKIPYHPDNVWDNLIYYIKALSKNYTNYNFPYIGYYVPSSSAIVRFNDKWLMNVRYVNYNIGPTGQYLIRSDDGIVRTTNALTYLDNNMRPLTTPVELTDSSPVKAETPIRGYEDVRLFTHNNDIYFSATTMDIVPSGKLRIALGKYDPEKLLMHDISVLEPPVPTECEKNWLFISHDNKMKVIYNWYPMQIGEIEDNKLVIKTSYDMPQFFSRLRGSANPIEYNGKLWCLVHGVRYSTPRIYYHIIVQLNKDTLKPEAYSYPFYFRKPQIEYSVGMNILNNTLYLAFSQNDCNTGLIEKPLNNIKFITI
jgi:hypothetical protein